RFRAASVEPSVDALSTRTVSQETPVCATADARATGRSGPLSFETTTMETSIMLVGRRQTADGRTQARCEPEDPEVRPRRLAPRARNLAAKRQERQAQDHAQREQRAVSGVRGERVALTAIPQGVAIQNREKARVTQPRGRVSSAMAHARLR